MYLKGNFWERYCSDEAMGYSACDEHNGVEKYVVLWLQGAKRRNRCQIGFFFLLPRHKQDAGSYKDSIIKSTENN